MQYVLMNPTQTADMYESRPEAEAYLQTRTVSAEAGTWTKMFMALELLSTCAMICDCSGSGPLQNVSAAAGTREHQEIL